jgi:hypothetical protein
MQSFAKSDYQLRHICLSASLYVSLEQFGSHWTDFHEIWNYSIFKTSVQNIIQVLSTYSVTLPRKSRRLWYNEKKYGKAIKATDDSKIRPMRIACWILQKNTQNM